MSTGPKHEIVIIRRGGHSDHDEHHGGVWKIAFADFMTAMMAFFLVMWLISANDKTRASVARYFNPVKLVDATTQPRGLHDPKKDDSGITASPDTKDSKGQSKDMTKETAGAKPDGPQPNETASGREKRLDAAMRDNPMVALAEIESAHGPSDELPKEKSQEKPRAATPVIGRNGGSAFRDPFAPPPMRQSAEATDEEIDVAPSRTSPAPTDPAKTTGPKVNMKSSAEKLADRKAAEIAGQLNSTLKVPGRQNMGPALDVRSTAEGLMVSLTDTGTFSMFSNGSAVPSKRVVLLVERVAKILASRPGSVVIRGFTDNKRFNSRRYDNWNLSFDRAQAAHYMLVRGGLADSRIAKVEGLADRVARPGIDPGSPLNRRIEILLQDSAK